MRDYSQEILKSRKEILAVFAEIQSDVSNITKLTATDKSVSLLHRPKFDK